MPQPLQHAQAVPAPAPTHCFAQRNESGDFPVIIDNLPPHVSTTQLYVVFRRYGTVRRASRTHHSQGVVNFASHDAALAAVKGEDHRQIQDQALRVSAAFLPQEAVTKGCWRCSLCKFLNAATDQECQGYMCGIQRIDGDIAAFDQLVEAAYSTVPAATPTPAPAPASAPVPASVPAPTDAHVFYAPTGEPAEHFYSDPSYEQPRAEAVEPLPDASQEEYAQGEDQQGDDARPPPPQPQRHCVVAMKIPTNITEHTLMKVFTKYSADHERSYVEGWIADQSFERENQLYGSHVRFLVGAGLSEAQVVFSHREYAQSAALGESGRMVDGKRIVCTYAAELFVVNLTLVNAKDQEHWAATETEEKVRERMGFAGAVDQVHMRADGCSIGFYTCTSALALIASLDGKTKWPWRDEWKAELAPNSRWPCMKCGWCNSSTRPTCSQCAAPRAPASAPQWWECVRRAVADGQGYNPYDGCGGETPPSTCSSDRRSSGNSGIGEDGGSGPMPMRMRRRRRRESDDCGSEPTPADSRSTSSRTPADSPAHQQSKSLQDPPFPTHQGGSGWTAAATATGGRSGTGGRARGHRGGGGRRK